MSRWLRSLTAAALVAAYGSFPIVLGSMQRASGATSNVNLTSSFQFSPQDKYIFVGDTVQWVDKDANSSDKHTVSSTSAGEPFDSSSNCPGLLTNDCITANNPTFTHQFQTVGTFTYECKIHASQGMIGTVHVRAIPQSTPPQTQSSSAPPQQTTTSSPSPTASPSPSASGSLSPSPTDSGLAGGPTGSGGGGGGRTIAIAIAGILGLGAAGYYVWARFIASS